jgi:hypothetical protein
MFSSLFGRQNTGQFQSVAAKRGMPPNPSEDFLVEYAEYGGGVGTTWITWSELTVIDWDEQENPLYYGGGQVPDPLHRRVDYIAGGWTTLFDMMEVLAAAYGAENVRLSIWFDQ